MNKPTKLILLLLSHVLFAVGGGVLGYLAHEKLVSSIAFVDEVALVSRAATYVDIQRAQGSTKDYKAALLAYLEVLEKYRHEPSVLFTERVHSVDKTLAYVRLARVAEAEGNRTEVASYSKNAVASCAGTGWKDCSKEKLWAITARLDKASFMGAGTNNERRGGSNVAP
ncbi:hypothetical protein [Sulfurifustis variabilis]|nr:hypothetical protein [Sulfurifustis variabilis]